MASKYHIPSVFMISFSFDIIFYSHSQFETNDTVTILFVSFSRTHSHYPKIWQNNQFQVAIECWCARRQFCAARFPFSRPFAHKHAPIYCTDSIHRRLKIRLSNVSVPACVSSTIDFSQISNNWFATHSRRIAFRCISENPTNWRIFEKYSRKPYSNFWIRAIWCSWKLQMNSYN